MSSALPQGTPSLSDKLKFLFATVRRPDKRKHTQEEVAAFIADRTGLKADRGYISALVTGARDNPSKKVLEALADFFDVSPAYFFDDSKSKAIMQQMELAVALRDGGAREVAARELLELDPDDVPMITEVMRSVRNRRAGRDSDPTG